MQQFWYIVIHVPREYARHTIADCVSRLHGRPCGIHGNRSVSTGAVTRGKLRRRKKKNMQRRFQNPMKNPQERTGNESTLKDKTLQSLQRRVRYRQKKMSKL